MASLSLGNAVHPHIPSGSGSELPMSNQSSNGLNPSPVMVNQSTAASSTQWSGANFSQPQYAPSATARWLRHRPSRPPTAQIMLLKAFRGRWQRLFVRCPNAIYFATQNRANVINMSFSVADLTPRKMAKAISSPPTAK